MLTYSEQQEILRRRTFAIVSHPDAGKTTLTEKLLLYGGAIHVAGAVKSNKIKRTATSDWMEIEKQRGISVATSVMGFDFACSPACEKVSENGNKSQQPATLSPSKQVSSGAPKNVLNTDVPSTIFQKRVQRYCFFLT